MSSENPAEDRADRSSLAILAPTCAPSFASSVAPKLEPTFDAPQPLTPTLVPAITIGDDFSAPTDDADQELDRDWKSVLGSLLGSWLFSLFAHIVLLLLLTLITFGSASGKLGLELSFSELDAAAESIAVDFDMAIDQSQLDVSDPELLESEESPLEPSELEVSALLESTESAAHVDPHSLFNLMNESGLQESAADDAAGSISAGMGSDGSPKMYGTSFFGLESNGSRFVFVIDCSGSMMEEYRWEKAVAELMRAISELERKSEFLVLLYNSQTFIMMDTPPRDISLVRATKRNVENLAKWLNSRSPAGLTRPAHAMAVGLSSNPDAIFLLSDGLIMDNTRQMLAAVNTGRPVRSGGSLKIPVHTIAMDAGEEGSTLLQWIAEENAGQYRSIR